MRFKADDPRFIFLPLNQVEKRFGHLSIQHIIRDAWWIVHPEKGLVFYNRPGAPHEWCWPQCNQQEHITRFIHAQQFADWSEVRQIPRVILPVAH